MCSYVYWCLFLSVVISAVPGASEQILTEKDLNVLNNLIHNHSSKWWDIGAALKFTHSELDLIRSQPLLLTGAPVSFMMQLLSQWVQWPTADHPTNPTLRLLCTALRSSSVGLGSLAEVVEKEMKASEAGRK